MKQMFCNVIALLMVLNLNLAHAQNSGQASNSITGEEAAVQAEQIFSKATDRLDIGILTQSYHELEQLIGQLSLEQKKAFLVKQEMTLKELEESMDSPFQKMKVAGTMVSLLSVAAGIAIYTRIDDSSEYDGNGYRNSITLSRAKRLKRAVPVIAGGVATLAAAALLIGQINEPSERGDILAYVVELRASLSTLIDSTQNQIDLKNL